MLRRVLAASASVSAVSAIRLCSCEESQTPPSASSGELMKKLTKASAMTADEYAAVDPSIKSMILVCVPNGVMLFQHYRGKTAVLVQFILKRFGVYGLFAVPFVGLAMEKSFYDTAMSLQGIDPNQVKPGREREGFPSGGAAGLPSLSLVPVKKLF